MSYSYGHSPVEQVQQYNFGLIEQAIQRCEVDFNGNLRLRFLFEDGGYGNQKHGELEETHFVIQTMNKLNSEKK